MSRKTYQVGNVVEVGPAYRGAGQYRPDGTEGIYTVCGVLGGSSTDYYLARGFVGNPEKAMWDILCNPSRMTLVRTSWPYSGHTSRTYRAVQKSRGCEEFGPSEVTYTDTVYADGRVVATARGYCDGEIVNAADERRIETPVDFDRIERSRLASGWTRVG